MARRCPKCGDVERVKCGIVHGIQRWQCKKCNCKYTKENKRGYSSELKEKAKKMHLEGLGFRAIGRLLRVSNVTVLNWIKSFGSKAISAQREQVGKVSIMEIDEMYSFVVKKTSEFGCGWLLIELPRESLASGLVAVAKRRSAN